MFIVTPSFQKVRFQNVFRLQLKRRSSVFKFLRFEERFRIEKLGFRDGLVWTVGLTVEIKLGFRSGLVWTVGLTVKIKQRFQIPPA